MTLKKTKKEIQEEEQANKKENMFAVAIVVLVFVALGVWIFLSLQSDDDEGVRVPLSFGSSATLGSRNATVKVFEFSDYECPYCAEFALEEFPEIKARFIDTGQVEFVYVHFPLTQIHEYALVASQAAECAHDQGFFWEYHDVLYEHQDALDVESLLAYGEQFDMDQERFQTCLTNEERREVVIGDKDSGIKAGVTGTPTFFFNGRKVSGSMTVEEFAYAVERELE